MRARGLLLAGSFSFLPFALALVSGGRLRVEGATWTGLALAPWLVLAGLPREPIGAARAERWTWLLPVALALPGVALAAGLDTVDAHDAAQVAGLGGGGLVLVGLWSLAAGAVRSRRAGTWYGALWLALVPGAAALFWALVWAPASTGSASPAALEWGRRLASGLPLFWLGRFMERGPEEPGAAIVLGWLANAGVVLAVGGLVRALGRSEAASHGERT